MSSNTKLPALPPHPAIRDGITWRDDERKAIDEYARAAILADRERQAGEAVARVRTWTKNGEGHGEMVDWLGGADALPDGEHDLYAATIASLPAPQAVQAELGPLSERTVLDAIRSAYDLGYNDARNARALPGDGAPGYKGRDVEADHGGALISRLRLLAASPSPDGKAEQAATEVIGYISKRGLQALRRGDSPTVHAKKGTYDIAIGVVREASKAEQAEAPSGCELKCTEVCKAKEHGCASECPALPWQPAATQPTASNAGEREALIAQAEHIQTYLDGLAIPTLDDDGAPLTLIARINVMTGRCVKAKKDLAESRYQTAVALEQRLNATEEELERVRAALATKPPAGEQKPVRGLDLAVIGRKHFGNPIPPEWYAAARELVAPQPEQPAQDGQPLGPEDRRRIVLGALSIGAAIDMVEATHGIIAARARGEKGGAA